MVETGSVGVPTDSDLPVPVDTGSAGTPTDSDPPVQVETKTTDLWMKERLYNRCRDYRHIINISVIKLKDRRNGKTE